MVNTLFVPLASTAKRIPVMVIDPGDERCVAELEAQNFEPKAVVLTHGPFDPGVGLGALIKAFPSIPVAMHPADSAQFGPGMHNRARSSLLSMGLPEDMVRMLQERPAANVALSEGCTLDVLFSGDAEMLRNAASAWRVLSTPGHTPGSVCLYNSDERALISGDTMFEGTWGRTDFPEGSDSDMRKSLQRLFKELPGETIVYPGHEGYGFTLAQNRLPV
jgi:glyoxylase-like metal-dependent hydrolase (beta-lactamase superfamily II)